jgi:NADPH:quinone reductase-like Zn-dependent oxidoreductase
MDFKSNAKTLFIELAVTSLCLYKLPYTTLFLTGIISSYLIYQNSSKRLSSSDKISDKNRKIMKACIYDAKENFKVVNDISIPAFSENEALVQVKSAAINPVDYKLKTCNLPFVRHFIPLTVGRDFSGVVVDIGKNVKNLKIGDEVFGNAKGGSLQEYTVVDPNQIALKPKNKTHTEAASIALAACTSLQALKFFGDLKDKKVLIIGASGGCGSFGVEIAKYYGATVFGVCSSRNVDFVKSLGADKVLDYSKNDYLEEIKNEKFDLIYDTVTSPEDPDQEPVYRRFLKEDGKWVAINGSVPNFTKGILRTFAKINLEKKDFHVTLLNWNTEDLTELARMSEENKLKTHFKTFKLEKKDVDEAFDLLKSRRTVGKLVFEIDV